MRYSVVGAGRSGVAASNTLVARGFDVALFDDRIDMARPAGLDERVHFVSGSHAVRDGDIAVLSPGIPEVSPARIEIERRASRVIGEIELFHELCRAPVLAITGTDGKSTTTTMLGAIVAATGKRTVVGGNLGNPLTGELDSITDDTVVVGEISCFQLTTCHNFRPRVAIVTNIAEDHIDYHGSFAAYQAAKRRIWQAMTREDTVILNGDDPYITKWLDDGLGPVAPTILMFSVARSDCAAFADSESLFVTLPSASSPVPFMRRDELPLLGIHNIQNALAAAQAAVTWGVSVEACREALMTYEPLPHRLKRVAVIDGVTWVNDSKATNPNAAMAGIRAISGPLIALVGGSSKDADFSDIAQVLKSRARLVVCFGQTRELLKDALRDHPAVVVVTSMQDAMMQARQAAHAGETVLLSPACASFDAFKGYAHRGEVFEDLVRSWT